MPDPTSPLSPIIRRSLALALAAAALSFATPSCVDDLPQRAEAGLSELELIGINGRRVQHEASYWIPLDRPAPLPLWQPAREAMAVRNTGPGVLAIEAVTLHPLGDTLPDELRLLAPRRAVELPLAAGPYLLAPETQLDLDVGVLPRVSGVRRAELRVALQSGEVHVAELRALGAGERRPWPGAHDPPARLESHDGGRLSVSALVGAPGHLTAAMVGTLDQPLVVRAGEDGRPTWSRAHHLAGGEAPAPCGPRGGFAGVRATADGDALEVVSIAPSGQQRWARGWLLTAPVEGHPGCAEDGDRLVVAAHVGDALTVVWVDASAGTLLAARRVAATGSPLSLTALAVGGEVVWLAGGWGDVGVLAAVTPGGSPWSVAVPLPPRGIYPDGAEGLLVAWGEGEASTLWSTGPGWSVTLPIGVETVAPGVHGERLIVAGWREGELVLLTLDRASGRLDSAVALAGPTAIGEGPVALWARGEGLGIAYEGNPASRRWAHWYRDDAWPQPTTWQEPGEPPLVTSEVTAVPWRDLAHRTDWWDASRDLRWVDGPMESGSAPASALMVERLSWP